MWISRQILREYAASLTRPRGTSPALPVATVTADISGFLATFQIAEDCSAVTTQWLALLGSTTGGGKQVYDANIVATMQTYGLSRLLTNNVADFTRFGSIITVLPLVP